jgi:hypothetical protein
LADASGAEDRDAAIRAIVNDTADAVTTQVKTFRDVVDESQTTRDTARKTAHTELKEMIHKCYFKYLESDDPVSFETLVTELKNRTKRVSTDLYDWAQKVYEAYRGLEATSGIGSDSGSADKFLTAAQDIRAGASDDDKAVTDVFYDLALMYITRDPRRRTVDASDTSASDAHFATLLPKLQDAVDKGDHEVAFREMDALLRTADFVTDEKHIEELRSLVETEIESVCSAVGARDMLHLKLLTRMNILLNEFGTDDVFVPLWPDILSALPQLLPVAEKALRTREICATSQRRSIQSFLSADSITAMRRTAVESLTAAVCQPKSGVAASGPGSGSSQPAVTPASAAAGAAVVTPVVTRADTSAADGAADGTAAGAAALPPAGSAVARPTGTADDLL